MVKQDRSSGWRNREPCCVMEGESRLIRAEPYMLNKKSKNSPEAAQPGLWGAENTAFSAGTNDAKTPTSTKRHSCPLCSPPPCAKLKKHEDLRVSCPPVWPQSQKWVRTRSGWQEANDVWFPQQSTTRERTDHLSYTVRMLQGSATAVLN